GTLVRMGRKGPRISAGASGFRSKVSMWLGPPLAQNRMTEKSLLSDRCSAAKRRARFGWAPETSAPRLNPPTFSQVRRSSGPGQQWGTSIGEAREGGRKAGLMIDEVFACGKKDLTQAETQRKTRMAISGLPLRLGAFA